MAFGASPSPSSQHQHCTEEAQDVYLTLFRQVLWNVLNRCTISFADMAFGRSVVLHFPQEIQKNLGISEDAPQLLRALDAEMIDAVQFLNSGRVRVTCKTAEYRDDLLEGSTFLFGDVPIPVTAADQNIRFVFVRDLPFEVPDDDVKFVFERFGVVHSMSPCFFRDFLAVSSGTRRLVMSFREAILSSVWLIFLFVSSMLANLSSVLFVMRPVICLGPVLFRACSCAASSQVTWPETVRRPGAPPVPMYLFLRRLPVLLPPCPLTLQCRLLLPLRLPLQFRPSFRYRSCFSLACYHCVYTYSIRASCFNVPCACVIRYS